MIIGKQDGRFHDPSVEFSNYKLIVLHGKLLVAILPDVFVTVTGAFFLYAVTVIEEFIYDLIVTAFSYDQEFS